VVVADARKRVSSGSSVAFFIGVSFVPGQPGRPLEAHYRHGVAPVNAR
jgi:hypothetical protein